MEFQLQINFPTIFTFLIFLVTVLTKLLVDKSKPNKNLPPGPTKLPIIGNLHNLINGSLPHQSLRDLAKKYGPIMHLQLGEVPTIVISSPDMAKQILKTHDITFASRPSLVAPRIMSYDHNDIAFAPYGNYWRQQRKICVTELLNANRVKSFRSVREVEAKHFIKSLFSREGSPVNLTREVFSLMHTVVARAAFGEKCRDQESFISVVRKSIEVSGGFCLADLYPSVKFLGLVSGMKVKLMKLHRETDRILDDIVKEHREKKVVQVLGGESGSSTEEAKEDLVDVLLKIQKNGDLQFPLTDENIKAVILDVFGAGGDTSATTIDWAMAEMMINPKIMKEAQAEVRQVFDEKGYVDEQGLQQLKLLKSIIKETLRLHPPVPLLLPRECRETCEINAYTIPSKTRVLVNAWAIGRDPSYWKDEPERFKPERFLDGLIDHKGNNFEYIPFGGGRRICPGMSFALPAMELPLAQLLYHFDWKLPDGKKLEDLDMAEGYGINAKRKNDLVVVPVAYRPSHASI